MAYQLLPFAIAYCPQLAASAVCFAILPDKKRSAYDAMFGMLREALETRGLELSAEHFMSDFDTAKRDSGPRDAFSTIQKPSSLRFNGTASSLTTPVEIVQSFLPSFVRSLGSVTSLCQGFGRGYKEPLLSCQKTDRIPEIICQVDD